MGPLSKFQQSGHGDVAKSWGSGQGAKWLPTPTPPPSVLARSVRRIIKGLAQKTKMSEEELAAQLSEALTRLRRQADAGEVPSNA